MASSAKTCKKKIWTKKFIWDIIFYTSIIAWPVVQFCIMWIGVNINSFTLSMKSYNVDKMGYDFVWFDNFKDVFHDLLNEGLLFTALGNSLWLYALSLFVCMPAGILISYYIFKKLPLSGAFKVILYLPSFISGLVLTLIFSFLADRGYPEIMLKLTGTQPFGLLAGEHKYATVICYWFFFHLASGILLYVGGMSTISESLFEAARLDGANMMHEFRYIIIPGIFPTIQTYLITGAAGVLTADPNLFLFFDTKADPKYWTFGYYMFVGVKEASPTTGYPYYAAFGLILSFMAIPIVFGMRWLTAKLDPMREA